MFCKHSQRSNLTLVEYAVILLVGMNTLLITSTVFVSGAPEYSVGKVYKETYSHPNSKSDPCHDCSRGYIGGEVSIIARSLILNIVAVKLALT